ncbi:MAG: YfiR family protein [Acidovorax sp.]|nr:YfiR family protein [Acidovorax sp.]
MPTALHFRATLLIGLWAFCWGAMARADTSAGELDLKSAYVFNFIQFIEWPDNSASASASGTGDWTICVSAFSPLKRPLTALEGRPARKGRIIRVRLLEIRELRSCQMVVMHSADVEQVLGALKSLPAEHGILTIAEEVTFAHPDIMITLYQVDGRVVFGIRADAASAAGLSVSSRLLRLARAGK